MSNNPTIDELIEILRNARTIAVVGASPDPWKAANSTPEYMQEVGYDVIPVNPFHDQVLGRPSYKTLLDLPEAPDIVNVFRPSDDTEWVAEQAVAIGAKVLWLQMGISNERTREIAEAGGMTVVMNNCISAFHGRNKMPHVR